MNRKLESAHRYAKAIFAVVSGADLDQLGSWEKFLKIAAIIVNSLDDVKQLDSYHIKEESKLALFSEIITEPGDCYNFIRILARQHQLALLPNIALIYSKLLCKHKKRLEVKVVSAIELSEPQQQSLVKVLSNKYNKGEILLQCTVDRELLGGMILSINRRKIDWSVRGELESLRKYLLAKERAC